jgi:ligand-binding sensor domain-containing protein
LTVAVTNPMGPGNFDTQFGYTYYNTNNSHELVMNNIRSLLADENGVWVGYGDISNNGKGGVSFISNDFGGFRKWDYCINIQGKPIGHRINSLLKAKDSSIWVATDGDGVWRLQNGKWEQFLFDPSLNDDKPVAATFSLASSTNVFVGDWDGITRWTGATWERVFFNNQVVTMAIDENGKVWVGYLDNGASLNPWENGHIDFNVENGTLASNAVRSIAIDENGRVWVGTDGGGISVYNNGQWQTYNTENSGILSDSVRVINIDKYDRVWVGTNKGTSYFDGTKWIVYTNLPTSAIAFNKVPHETCSPEETVWDVWIGTDDQGLINSRLPAISPVILEVTINDIPTIVNPNQTFTPSITIKLEKGYKLSQGDFIQVMDNNNFTSVPLIGLPEGYEVKGGESYTFNFEKNPIKAPEQIGTYTSTWRLWQCGRYVGDPIIINFTVNS